MYPLLVLSGGGIKGIAQLGSIQYLIDQSLVDITHIRIISATSVGTMIAFLLSIGYSPIEILIYLVSNSILEKMVRNSLKELYYDNGLYNWDTTVGKCLEDMCREKGYDQSPTLLEIYNKNGIQLIFTTTNLTKQRIEYLHYLTHPDMTCIQAIRLSCNLPFFFGKYIYLGEEYCDGGILDNFPLLPLTQLNTVRTPESILGITFPIESSIKQEEPNEYPINRMMDKLYCILRLPICYREQEKIEKIKDRCNIDIIEIQTIAIPFYNMMIDTNRKTELFSLGYNSTKQYFLNKELFPYGHLSSNLFD